MQPKVDDHEKGVDYWEVFDRRRRLQRMSDFSAEQIIAMPRETRLELLRQLVLRVKILHDINAAHLNIGPHSVWIEKPSIARLSHLMAASYPDIASLGSSRYQFLSNVCLPEEHFDAATTAQRKDVYLLGCVAHYLLLGSMPKPPEDDAPPEWNATEDPKGTIGELHSWLAKALEWAPDSRFADAGEMLDALNAALDTKPSAKSILEGLERFRKVASQMKLWREYPPEKELRDDARIAMWTSRVQGKTVLVKMWKREGWGDQAKEAPRLLDFLEHAEALKLDHPVGCVAIQEPLWTGDALVLVQEYLDVPTLTQACYPQPSEQWGSRVSVLQFLRSLSQVIITLHERQIAHGDLKPDNILVIQQDGQPAPVLIDLLDFVPGDDGERMSTVYAPSSGGRFERDCYAVTKISEELLAISGLDDADHKSLNVAISKIRTGPPENATLLPLVEAIDAALRPVSEVQLRRLDLVIPRDSGAVFLTDEGHVGLVLSRNGRKLCVRGATEQIAISLDENFKFTSARRQSIEQRLTAKEARFKFASIAAYVHIEDGLDYDLRPIEELLADPTIEPLWRKERSVLPTRRGERTKSLNSDPDEDADEAEDADPSPEAAQDWLFETVVQQGAPDSNIDVPKLWERLLDLEAELTIGGTAIGPSVYKEMTQRHHVPFELESGSFDFARDDTVTVSRLDRHGRWGRIGQLDLSLSTPSHLEIITRNRALRDYDILVADAQELRFESHFEVTSRSRRRAATLRLLAHEARISNLTDVFHPRMAVEPTIRNNPIDQRLITHYGFNIVQANAFAKLVGLRPVGLLQGPPGTGKTQFIGALVHYALSTGLARNVLLASQSHEAVNGAAEAVIKLFGDDDEAPSILRVGHEGNVSDQLLPYHAGRVEGLIKDRFKAEQKLRLHVIGRALSIPPLLVDQLITLETVIRPIVEKIVQLEQRSEEEGVDKRVSSLCQTLEMVVGSLNVPDIANANFDEDYMDLLADKMAINHHFHNAAKVESFREVAELARDFMGSAPSRERNFETFLAGTRRIVAGTCVGLGRSSLGLTATPFDLVIVDEAARCTPGELAVPLQSGRWIVLVGDHRQLEPQHRAEVVEQVAKQLRIRERDVMRSDFERVFDSRYGKAAGASLTEQYRMLPPIGEIVSNAFYHGKLTHGRSHSVIDLPNLPDALHKPLTWISTDALAQEGFQREVEGRRGALQNPAEADLIVNLVKCWDSDQQFRDWIKEQKQFPKTIGIICTYLAQSQLIQKKLKRAGLSTEMLATLKTDTVDSYQGKENPIVILSLVRNNDDGSYEDGVPTIRDGFMSQPNRLNVAMSRAMDRLVLVGAASRWRAGSPMASVAREFKHQVRVGNAVVINGVELKAQFEGQIMDGRQATRGVVEGEGK